jgi:hypothetical protein
MTDAIYDTDLTDLANIAVVNKDGTSTVTMPTELLHALAVLASLQLHDKPFVAAPVNQDGPSPDISRMRNTQNQHHHWKMQDVAAMVLAQLAPTRDGISSIRLTRSIRAMDAAASAETLALTGAVVEA